MATRTAKLCGVQVRRGTEDLIHHVERYTVIDNFATHFTPKSPRLPTCPHFLYDLGPAIRPTHRVPTNGNGYSIYPSGRKWIFIDLLLTAKSVAERPSYKQRLKEVEQDPINPGRGREASRP